MSGDLTRLHFADRSFDIMISFRQLPHLRHRRLLAAERSPVARYAVIVQYPTTRSFHKTLSLIVVVETGLRTTHHPTLRNLQGRQRGFKVRKNMVS